jgi:ATP-dependent helicase/nuclease subunit B
MPNRQAKHERHFLGWNEPLLSLATAFLRERFSKAGKWDLSGVDLVLPTSRGATRLRQLLAQEVNSEGSSTPASVMDLAQEPAPSKIGDLRILTVGEIAEKLYQPPRTIASSFEQTLAWAQSLRLCSADELAPLVPTPPPPEPLGPWIELAATIRRLFEDISAAGLTFEDIHQSVETESERRRWKLLTYISDQYIDRLKQANLCDPYNARREAIHAGVCRSHRTIVLIGTTDLSATQEQMLSAVDATIHVLIAAPEIAADGFDQYGSVDRQWWSEAELPLERHQLIVAGDVTDQAQAVAESIKSFQASAHPHWTIGVTDQSQIAPIEFTLRRQGYSMHRNSGYRLDRAGVSQLLLAVSEYLERRTWEALAIIARHPDWLSQLESESKVDGDALLANLDTLLSNHYPVAVDDPLPPSAIEAHSLARTIPKITDKLLMPLRKPGQSLAERCETLATWIQSIYKKIDKAEPRSQMAVQQTIELLSGYQSLKSELDVPMTITAVIETLLDQMQSMRIISEPNPGDTEILGWLDLAFDDSPAMVVVGLNHPFVPSATTSDPFLPGSMRSRLRVSDNERRFARDAHALRCIVSSRPEIRLIVGSHSADGSPTPPSRLVGSASPDEVASRIRHLMQPRSDRKSYQHPWLGKNLFTSIVPPTLPMKSQRPITTMSVTAFKEYLDCPYRFYLRRVLKASPLDDSGAELAANQFGDLVHHAMEIYGDSQHKSETNPRRIEAAIIDAMDAVAKKYYGPHVSPAVKLQVGQAKRRAANIARAQAERIADGWLIHQVEAKVDEDVAGIEVDGKRMGLRGRFDRIDYHPATGRWAILDYKTHAHKPEKKHLGKDDSGNEIWIDLQLPLYRRMIPFLGIHADVDDVQLGYFNIADKDTDTKINIANFTVQQKRQADELIEQVVRNIFAGKFDPAAKPPEYDDYANRNRGQHDGVCNRSGR